MKFGRERTTQVLLCVAVVVGLALICLEIRDIVQEKNRREFWRRYGLSCAYLRVMTDYYSQEWEEKIIASDSPTSYVTQLAKLAAARYGQKCGPGQGLRFRFGIYGGEECLIDGWNRPFVAIWTNDVNKIFSKTDASLPDWLQPYIRIGKCCVWSCGRNGINNWGRGDDVH